MLTTVEIHKPFYSNPAIQKFRKSKGAYAYKISEILGQSPSFPCETNHGNPFSRGCHVSERIDEHDEYVLIKESDDVLPEIERKRLIKNKWIFEGREENLNVFAKKKRELSMDEWCFSSCRNSIKIAYLSPLQLKTYELLRAKSFIILDIKNNQNDEDFYNYLCTLSTYPKIVDAIKHI